MKGEPTSRTLEDDIRLHDISGFSNAGKLGGSRGSDFRKDSLLDPRCGDGTYEVVFNPYS
jgi:hypothetical protein